VSGQRATVENAFDTLDPYAHGFNIAEVLEHWARVQPDVLAVARADGRGDDGHSVFLGRTFGELNAQSDRWAQALCAAGVTSGDRVLLFITDPIDFFTAVYACCKLQAVWVLIDPGMGVKNMLECVAEQRPTALLGIRKAQVLARVFGRAFKTVKARVLVGGSWFPGARALTKMVERLPADVRDAPLAREQRDPGDTTAIFYTSGSTGVPKGVVFTHSMMGAQQRAMREMFDLQPGTTQVACFPPFALIVASLGMSAVVPEMEVAKPAATDPERVLDALRSYDAQSAFASPALWEPFSRHVVAHDVKLPHLKKVLTAGAPVQPALHERLLSALPNGDVFTPYGATEALPIAAIGGREVLAHTAAETRAGGGTCVGKPSTLRRGRSVRSWSRRPGSAGPTTSARGTTSSPRWRAKTVAGTTAWVTSAASTTRGGCGSADVSPTAWRPASGHSSRSRVRPSLRTTPRCCARRSPGSASDRSRRR